jgi:two-component system chemotaxis sensor kinase CheA
MTDVFGAWSEAEQAELKQVFYGSAIELVENIQDELLKLEAGTSDGETLRALKRHVHTLKGDSGSVGFSSVAGLCHRMEDVLALLTDGRGAARQEVLELLLSSNDALRALLANGESGAGSEEQLGLSHKIEVFLNGVNGSNRLNGLSRITLNEYQDLQAREAAEKGLRLYEVEAFIHPQCAEKTIAARMALARLAEAGRIIYSLPDSGGEGMDGADRVVAVLATDRDQEELTRMTVLAGLVSEVLVREFSRAGSEVRNAEARTNVTAEPRAAEPEPRTEFLRIEAARVDRLMNLVGELMIGRSMVADALKDVRAAGAHDAAARLREINGYLERTISDLQKGVMKMRMVPVNQILRKFPRVVRDLSAEKGKQARLEIAGKETELDKGIVDGLAEPLTHIIRNMIDHGLEAPEVRLRLGKPAEGLILVRAYHEAAQIVIETSDDGRGIDTEKLKELARGKGLVSAEEAARMTEAEAAQLVFVPGLSTAETVTETSGRGIGMDAVKTAVEGMRGSLELHSTPGKGTMVRLRLPLTLAVIKALLFQVGEKLYALPLSAIAEITKVSMGELTTMSGKDTLLLRDQALSLIRAERLFKIAGHVPEKRFALILRLGGRRVGLLVDRIAGQQELVIKSLQSELSRSGLIAGASILGDGKVVVILDALGVVRKAIEDEKEGIIHAA